MTPPSRRKKSYSENSDYVRYSPNLTKQSGEYRIFCRKLLHFGEMRDKIIYIFLKEINNLYIYICKLVQNIY